MNNEPPVFYLYFKRSRLPQKLTSLAVQSVIQQLNASWIWDVLEPVRDTNIELLISHYSINNSMTGRKKQEQ